MSVEPNPPPEPADDVEPLVAAIHESSAKLALAITGGGSGAIGELLAVPGGSRTVLEAIVPYADRALDEFLGGAPEQYCSPRTARRMAMAAFLRAKRLAPVETRDANSSAAAPLAIGTSPDEDSPRSQPLWMGVGATASLASSRPKRGAHRLHLALQTLGATRTASLEFMKGARTRRGEERLAALTLLNELAAELGLAARIDVPWLAGEAVCVERIEAPRAWRELLFGARRVAGPTEDRSDETKPESRRGLVLLSGAFNPLHEGHRRMGEVAERKLQRPVAGELSVWNVDKPPLDYHEIDARRRAFEAWRPLWLTRAPTFVEKARLFPGATFVVGADTIERIGQTRYYGDRVERRDEALAELAANNCRFLVFGRVAEGQFRGLREIELPAALRAICDGVDEQEFRLDVSSTALRRAACATE